MIYTIDKSKQTKEGLACSKACQKVLTDKLSMEETEKEIAYIALNYGFEELSYRNFNMSMPRDLMDYLGSPFKDKKVESSFWTRKDIAEYTKAKNTYDSNMNSHFAWLKELKGIFQKHNDFDSASKCDVKINEYEQYLKMKVK